jgi:hypothetical protein
MAAVRVTGMNVAQMQVAELQVAEAAHECQDAQHQANAKADEIPIFRTQ